MYNIPFLFIVRRSRAKTWSRCRLRFGSDRWREPTPDSRRTPGEFRPWALSNPVCDPSGEFRRLQSLLVWLRRRAESDWERGSREALLQEAVREQWQLQRLALRRVPPAFPHLVVTGPAPWRANFLAARRFCATSLMAANAVVLSMLPIWDQM